VDCARLIKRADSILLYRCVIVAAVAIMKTILKRNRIFFFLRRGIANFSGCSQEQTVKQDHHLRAGRTDEQGATCFSCSPGASCCFAARARGQYRPRRCPAVVKRVVCVRGGNELVARQIDMCEVWQSGESLEGFQEQRARATRAGAQKHHALRTRSMAMLVFQCCRLMITMLVMMMMALSCSL